MLISVIEVVKRPHKISIEIRSTGNSNFTVSLVSRSSRSINPVINKLREVGYREDLDRVDRNGFLRIVFHNMSESDIRVIESIVRKYIGANPVSNKRGSVRDRKGRRRTVLAVN